MSELKLALGRGGWLGYAASLSHLRLDYFAGPLNPANQVGTALVVAIFSFRVVLALGLLVSVLVSILAASRNSYD